MRPPATPATSRASRAWGRTASPAWRPVMVKTGEWDRAVEVCRAILDAGDALANATRCNVPATSAVASPTGRSATTRCRRFAGSRPCSRAGASRLTSPARRSCSPRPLGPWAPSKRWPGSGTPWVSWRWPTATPPEPPSSSRTPLTSSATSVADPQSRGARPAREQPSLSGSLESSSPNPGGFSRSRPPPVAAAPDPPAGPRPPPGGCCPAAACRPGRCSGGRCRGCGWPWPGRGGSSPAPPAAGPG
jgi:hypothetical protein